MVALFTAPAKSMYAPQGHCEQDYLNASCCREIPRPPSSLSRSTTADSYEDGQSPRLTSSDESWAGDSPRCLAEYRPGSKEEGIYRCRQCYDAGKPWEFTWGEHNPRNCLNYKKNRTPAESRGLVRSSIDSRVWESDIRLTPPELHHDMSEKIGWNTKTNFDPCPHPVVEDEFGRPVDGLTIDWKNRTYCNPPFKTLDKWAYKAIDEFNRGKEIVFLAPTSKLIDSNSGKYEPWWDAMQKAGGRALRLRRRKYQFENPHEGGSDAAVDVTAIHLCPRDQQYHQEWNGHTSQQWRRPGNHATRRNDRW